MISTDIQVLSLEPSIHEEPTTINPMTSIDIELCHYEPSTHEEPAAVNPMTSIDIEVLPSEPSNQEELITLHPRTTSNSSSDQYRSRATTYSFSDQRHLIPIADRMIHLMADPNAGYVSFISFQSCFTSVFIRAICFHLSRL